MNVSDIRIETERLILRPPQIEDFDGWTALLADAESARFIGGAVSRPEAWRNMMVVAGSWAIHGFGMFSVIEKAGNRWIGRIGPWQPEGWPGTEVGWGLLRDAWGKGYAAEAAAASMDYAFDVLDWERVIHTIVPANEPSRKLAQRLGSQHLGTCHLPPPIDEPPNELWGQTREQWQLRRTRKS